MILIQKMNSFIIPNNAISILDEIGDGSYGKIYAIVNETTHENQAIKRNFSYHDIDFSYAFRDLDIFLKTQHPYVLLLKGIMINFPYYQFFNPPSYECKDEYLSFVYEKAECDGYQIIKKTNSYFKWMMVNLLLGLEYIHSKGIIHRDIKPGNFLFFNHTSCEINDNKLPKDIVVNDNNNPPKDIVINDNKPSQNIVINDKKPSQDTVINDKKLSQNIVINDKIPLQDTVINDNKKPSIQDYHPLNKKDPIIKITDFSLSEPYTQQLPQIQRVITMLYRPPELLSGNTHYDYKVDVWSLACSLMEILTGRPPFVIIKNKCNTEDKVNQLLLSQIRKDLFLVKSSNCNNPKILENYLHLSPIVVTQTFGNEYPLFLDLLSQMLLFDPSERITTTQALNHSFFNSLRQHIEDIHRLFPPTPLPIPSLIINQCQEREWMWEEISHLYHCRNKIPWYSDRILFHTINLIDRFLCHISETKVYKTSNTQRHGFYLTRRLAIKYFYSCLYISLKYFAINLAIPSYREISHQDNMSDTEFNDSLSLELYLIKDICHFEFYETTLFEISDMFHHRLRRYEIDHLLSFLEKSNGNLGSLKTIFQSLFPNPKEDLLSTNYIKDSNKEIIPNSVDLEKIKDIDIDKLRISQGKQGYKLIELREECQKHQLKSTGNKSELVERLLQFLNPKV